MEIHLGIVLLCLPVSSAIGSVSFSQKNFTLTCPGKEQETFEWFKDNQQAVLEKNSRTYTPETQGHYRCEYKNSNGQTVKYHFYVKREGCDCFELNPVVVAVGIVTDAVLTLAVILFVYIWARRTKSARATPKKESSTGPSSGPPTASHYEPLSPNSRSDPYSTVHRMG